jgi:hypothetical protein
MQRTKAVRESEQDGIKSEKNDQESAGTPIAESGPAPKAAQRTHFLL